MTKTQSIVYLYFFSRPILYFSKRRIIYNMVYVLLIKLLLLHCAFVYIIQSMTAETVAFEAR